MRRLSALLVVVLCLAVPAVAWSQEAPTDTARQHIVDRFLQKDPNPGNGDSGCSICVYKIDTNTLSCSAVTNGTGFTKCKITRTETEATCESSGSSCTVTQLNP